MDKEDERFVAEINTLGDVLAQKLSGFPGSVTACCALIMFSVGRLRGIGLGEDEIRELFDWTAKNTRKKG